MEESGVSPNDAGAGLTINTYEPSPLNRIADQNAPGTSWQTVGRATNTSYFANSSADEIHDYSQGNRNTDKFGDYELNVTQIIDENGNISRTYVDKIGRTIMTERVLDNVGTVARTYTVYDDYNNPIAIIPPELAKDMENNDDWNIYNVNNFRRIYAYQYDKRRLVKIKAVPGGGTTKLFYNKLDLPVMSIDNNSNKIITKYDILNRPIITGRYFGNEMPDNSNTDPVFETIDGAQTHDYTITNSFPKDSDNSNLAVHTVTYYDDYDFDKNGTEDAMYLSPPDPDNDPITIDYEPEPSTWTRNMVTGLKTGILEADGSTNTFLETFTFYDDRMRVTQTQMDNHLNGQDIMYSSYNFPGWLLRTERKHTATVNGSPQAYTIKERYEYDHTGRETGMYHEIDNNGEIKTCSKEYDERGLLWQKGLHRHNATDYLQYVDYKYNIRGWMTDINNINFNAGCTGSAERVSDGMQPTDLFAMKLSYNFSAVPNISPQFNGNIAAMEWKIECDAMRSYSFNYDGFDRLTQADQYFGTNYQNVDRYSVPLINYDLDGNILSLQRNGTNTGGLVDDLQYTYSTKIPNHLEKVEDAADIANPNIGFKGAESSYTYDFNGNLKTDTQKGFTMSYNYLNLPYQADFSTSNAQPANNLIEWKYDAAGMKLEKYVTANSSQSVQKEYCNGIEYNNGSLEAIYFSEGRLVPDGAGWTYEYTLTDHLGNNRVTFKNNNGVAEAIDENHYYPFGMLIEDLTMRTNTPPNDYLYNGKELDSELGLDLQHYGARLYDGALGRFTGVDPLADALENLSWNPFGYVWNNPLIFIDPDGMYGKYYDQNGNLVYDDGIDDKKVYLTSQNAVDDAESYAYDETATTQMIQNNDATYELGTENEFGLIQLTEMGNPVIINNENTEDTYSYIDANGNTVAAGQHGDDWVTPATAAAFMAAVNDMISEWGGAIEIIVNDGSAYNPAVNLGHSARGDHSQGDGVDFRFMTIVSGGSNNIHDLSYFGTYMTGEFVSKLRERGFDRNFVHRGIIMGTTHQPNHEDHVHTGRSN